MAKQSHFVFTPVSTFGSLKCVTINGHDHWLSAEGGNGLGESNRSADLQQTVINFR